MSTFSSTNTGIVLASKYQSRTTVVASGSGTNSALSAIAQYGLVSDAVEIRDFDPASLADERRSDVVANLSKTTLAAARITSPSFGNGITLLATQTLTNVGVPVGDDPARRTDDAMSDTQMGVAMCSAGTVLKTSTTIGNYYHTVILNSPSLQNPATVGIGGLIHSYVGDGVLGTAGFSWTLTNLGTVAADNGSGVHLTHGGTVVNGQSAETGGVISGTDGLAIEAASGSVTNFGTISGQSAGVYISASGTLVNAGTIIGMGAGGGVIKSAGYVRNSGLILGYTWGIIFTSGGGTVINTGIIQTTEQGTDAGISGAERVINGAKNADRGLIVATSLGVAGSNITNYGTIQANNGVRVSNGTLANFGFIASKVIASFGDAVAAGIGGTVVNYGTIVGADGTGGHGVSAGSATVINFGTIISGINGQAVFAESATTVNFGTIIAGPGGSAMKFGLGNNLLLVEPNAVIAGPIAGFGSLDTIDFAHATATDVVFTGTTAGGTLTLINAGAVINTVNLTGKFSPNDFVLSPDGNGGINVNLSQPPGRYLSGTYTSTVILNNAGYNNSATVTSSGVVAVAQGDAIVNQNGVSGTLANFGKVMASAPTSHGVYLGSGGIVTNTPSGVPGGYISGAAVGVFIGGGPGTIGNAGTIRGGSGVLIAAGSTTTVSNSGTIAGTAGTAVSLGGGSNRLIVSPGASFQGVVDGGGGSSVLEVAGLAAGAAPLGSASVNALVNIGNARNFSQLQIDAGQPVAVGSNLLFDTLTNQGTVNLGSGNSLVLGAVASAANPGLIDLQSGGLVRFQGVVAANQTVLFQPPGGTVRIDQPLQFHATLANFAAIDTIDLATLPLNPLGTASLLAGNLLQVNASGQSFGLQLDPAQNFAGQVFHLGSDGTAGTAITVSAGPLFGVTTPLMTNTSGILVSDSVVSGQMSFTAIGGLGPEWQFDGSGFLLGDGKPGFLIRNTAGTLVVGEVANGVAVYTGIGGVGSEWDFEGNRDLLNDGQSQFLIRANSSSAAAGALAVGEVKNGATTFKLIGGLGVEWDFAGNGNFLNDGRQGFLVRANQNSAAMGALFVGEVVNNAASFTSIGGLGLEWDFKLVGDFLGDGHTAFMIRAGQQSAVSGALFVGEVENGSLQFTAIGGVGPEWEFVASGHYIDTTKDDFLLRNTGSGALVVGSVSGTTGNASVSYTTVGGVGSEWNFHTGNVAVLP